MNKKIAVVLSGCGFLDGSEVQEAVLTLLHLARAGSEYHCFAPDIEQTTNINHATKDSSPEKRNVLVESARIARTNIKNVKDLKAAEFDGIIFPGGFGAALNLCDFAKRGPDCGVLPEIKRVILDFYLAQKPIGAICIAPA